LEKKERYTSISYLESLPAAAAAVTDPLVFVTLLGDGEILAVLFAGACAGSGVCAV
jgi:hypothetical protein